MRFWHFLCCLQGGYLARATSLSAGFILWTDVACSKVLTSSDGVDAALLFLS